MAHTRCGGCGAFVTDDFARVFGDNDDTVKQCLECTTATDIVNGAAVERDRDGGRY